jgi:phosphoesterase RecJ-like protein
MGADLLGAIDLGRTAAIDHHLENPHFAAVNWVETDRSSVGEMIGELARDLSVPLEGPLAEAIYVAMATDTGNFSYSNTSARVMEMAAEIIRNGLDPGRINALLTNQWSPSRIRLWSRVLGSMEMCFQDRVGVIRILRSDLAATGTDAEDTDGIINTVRSIRGLKVAASLREDGDGRVKFSLRSHGDTNVQAVAAGFGGGGHRNAAGGIIPGSMDEAVPALLAALARMPELAPYARPAQPEEGAPCTRNG